MTIYDDALEDYWMDKTEEYYERTDMYQKADNIDICNTCKYFELLGEERWSCIKCIHEAAYMD